MQCGLNRISGELQSPTLPTHTSSACSAAPDDSGPKYVRHGAYRLRSATSRRESFGSRGLSPDLSVIASRLASCSSRSPARPSALREWIRIDPEGGFL